VALPDKVEELKAVLLEIIEPTRQEAGVIQYELFQNQSEPTDFTFVEQWESATSLNNHLASPHIKAGIAKLDGLVAAPPDIRSYSQLA
jgi:quinol monooxygenase YgiN